MKSIYTSYKCKNCRKETILITKEIAIAKKQNRYIACPYCNSKNMMKSKETDDLRQCMKENAYKKEHGVIKQVRYNEHS